ncbi:HAD-IC family P-type ATPase [Spiroplasma endosymbiont of Aspidapion aeneum]|uniref:HAD-IC family P-type ATPase n=1 Tax=Spiroplasma endosymbiont of Aspidapion aeneum TaxID=3066276 RepID=UPI00313C9C46
MKERKKSSSKYIKEKFTNQLFRYSKLDNHDLLKELNIPAFGNNKSRKKRISKFGTNISQKPRFSFLKNSLLVCIQPFNLLLICLIILDFLTYFVINKDHQDIGEIVSAIVSIIIFCMTFTINIIERYEEFKSEQISREMQVNNYFIIKNEIPPIDEIRFEKISNDLTQIKYDKITNGDVIILNVGDTIPCDMRILWSHNFKVNDNLFRGKDIRVGKSNKYKDVEEFYDLENIILAHSYVTDGYAICVAIEIGKKRLSNYVDHNLSKENKNFYSRGITKITKYLLLSVLIVFPIIFLTSYFTTVESLRVILDTLLYSITIVVSLIPEALPAIIGFILQNGSKHIKDDNIIVKKLDTIQNLGAMDLFISDVKGVITKDKPTLIKGIDINKNKSDNVMKLAYLNAYFQHSMHFHYEKAILNHYENVPDFVKDYQVSKELYVSLTQKNGSVFIRKNNIELKIVVTSLDDIFKSLEKYRDGENVWNISTDILFLINGYCREILAQGLEPLIVATKEININKKESQDILTFEGIIVFYDELRDDAQDAMFMFDKYNVDFKIQSNDSMDYLTHISSLIGIDKISPLDSQGFAKMNAKEQWFNISNTNIYNKLTNIQKVQVIKSYKKNNHVVGFLGDGRSDLQAIKAADIGITPNNSMPLAKRFADIIILENKLTTFDNTIKWGRITFLNTIKFLKLAITTNIGLFLFLAINGMWLTFVPMTNIDLLIQNLLVDICYIAFMVDKVDNEQLAKPIKWSKRELVIYVFINSIVQPIISTMNLVIICFGLDWYKGQNTTSENIKLIQSSVFVESFITKILLFFILRTNKILFYKDKPDYRYTLTMSIIMFLVVLLPFIPGLNNTISLEKLSISFIPVMVGNIVGCIFISSFIKYLYIKLFKVWL